MVQSQSARMTLIESVVGTIVSIVVGVGINMVVLPLLGYPIRLLDSLLLVSVFIVVSLARSYLVRRVFARLPDPWL